MIRRDALRCSGTTTLTIHTILTIVPSDKRPLNANAVRIYRSIRHRCTLPAFCALEIDLVVNNDRGAVNNIINV